MQDFNNPTHLIVSCKRLLDCYMNSESGALQDYKVITQIKESVVSYQSKLCTLTGVIIAPGYAEQIIVLGKRLI